jgi:CheY-like chemotaxis protein
MGDDLFDPSGLTALVLDENHYERAIAINQLRMLGFGNVLGASKASEAWDLLKDGEPDVFLLEWVERTGDGIDLVRRIRASDELPNRAIPIFMLTTRGRQADVESARLAGVDGFMRKPISALAMQQRVLKVVAAPQPFVETADYVGPCRRRNRNAGYAGALRRLEDAAKEAALELGVDEGDIKAEVARARVAVLERRARELAPGDIKAAARVYVTVMALVEAGEHLSDICLKRSAEEMARYIKAQGATDRLDPEVVRTHVAALHQLVHLTQAQAEERVRLTENLKRMVDKKLRQAPNAA